MGFHTAYNVRFKESKVFTTNFKQFTVFNQDWHLRKIHKLNSTFDHAVK